MNPGEEAEGWEDVGVHSQRYRWAVLWHYAGHSESSALLFSNYMFSENST